MLVIGATQGTGRHVVRKLLRDGWPVRVLARDPDKASAAFGDAVQVVPGDLTRVETLPPALDGVEHVVLTAGVTKRPAPQRLVKATEFDGTVNVLRAARETGLAGRLLYMSAMGTTRWSVLAFLLNLIKGNTLKWRRRGEAAIRESGIDYTIVHAGILSGRRAGERAIRVTQRRLPLSWRYRLGREDAAEVLVRALREPRTRNTTLDVWNEGEPADLDSLFAGVAAPTASRPGS
ncbi:MAG TPA: NAD(P)H-binding protein [Longimicrobiaceae bacterium]|nr:NAD(P)H-binding protein [Longimicrobiaceae bacterium]